MASEVDPVRPPDEDDEDNVAADNEALKAELR